MEQDTPTYCQKSYQSFFEKYYRSVETLTEY